MVVFILGEALSAAAYPDLELKRSGGRGCVLLALPAFLPSMISSFLPKIREEGRTPRALPPSG